MTYFASAATLLLPVCAIFSCSTAQGAYVYRVDANAGTPSPLHEYNTTTNTWAIKATLPGTGNYTSLAVDNGVLYALPTNNNIYRYDRTVNAWIFVRSGPSPAANQPIGLFEARDGRFFYGKDGSSTLSYTSGAAWSTATSPASLSSGSSVDPATGKIYIRTFGETGGMVFDPSTNTFTSTFTNTTNISENGRAGVYYNGFFYDRDFGAGQQMRKVNVSTGAFTNVGPALTTAHPGMDVDPAGNIYMNSYGGGTDTATFEVLNVVTGVRTTLANAPLLTSGLHPALAYVPEPTTLAIVALGGVALGRRRRA